MYKRFRDEYRRHYKALYKRTVYFTLLVYFTCVFDVMMFK